MKIPEYRNLVRQDLLDTSIQNQVFPDEAVDRAILASVEDFSRFLPAELFYELTVTTQDWTESFNLTSLGLVAPFTLTLAKKPLFYNSVTVKTGATTWVLNTDYTVDFTNGIISVPSTSTITPGATLTITYQLSRTAFDLSSLANLRSINAVEILYGRVPDEFSGFTLRGSMLTVTTRGARSQVNIPGNFHLRIAYEARHTAPDDDNDGTVYEDDAEVICKGASANLLFSKAVSIELAEAVISDDLSSLNIYFTEAESFFTTIIADLAAARASLVNATTQVASTVAQSALTSNAINNDLIDMAAKIASAEVALAQAVTDIAAGIAGVDTEVATLINAGIALIDTEVASDLSTANTINASTATALSNAAAQLVIGLADIALYGADLTLARNDRVAGEAFNNTVNVGTNPQELLEKYGTLATEISRSNILAGEAALKGGAEYISQATEYIREATSYIGIAEARIKATAEYNNAARELTNLLVGYTGAARELISVGQARIEEAKVDLESSKVKIALLQELLTFAEQYVKIAGGFHQGYVGVAETGVQAIGQKVALIQTGIAKATELRAQRDSIVKIAEVLRTEATRRYEDFKVMISDRNQLRRNGSTVATTQLG